jgi:sugar phosphate isomerase/epimerase
LEIGISTSTFYGKYTSDESLRVIGDLGVTLCEVFLSTFCEYSEEYAYELQGIVEEYGLCVHSIHAMSTQFEPQLFASNLRQRADAYRILEDVLRVAQILGAEYYTFHGALDLKRRTGKRDYAQLASHVESIADLCKHYGVCLAWENVHWCTYAHPGFAQELLKHTDCLGFTLDIKQAAFSGHTTAEYIEDMGKHLKNVHLCDYTLKDGLRARPIGQGECDFHELKHLLQGAGYTGPGILELYGENYHDPRELTDSIRYLEDVFNG